MREGEREGERVGGTEGGKECRKFGIPCENIYNIFATPVLVR